MTGTPSSSPSAPKLDTVNVEPCSSAGLTVPARASSMSRETASANSRVVLSCASLTTGTSSPRGAATPKPRCTAEWTWICGPPAVSTHVELNIG